MSNSKTFGQKIFRSPIVGSEIFFLHQGQEHSLHLEKSMQSHPEGDTNSYVRKFFHKFITVKGDIYLIFYLQIS